MSQQKTNHLATETSPYLQQHAHNPVDWYPWGDEALEKARRENKPILLSIGYAACHWCHVMAHESFEDENTAELMNELFVNIKVDREERPDLDKIYQTAHYLLTQQSGGWPLTIFLSPDDLTPFFSGTYFPRESRNQLPAFKEILRGIADVYQQRQADVKQQNAELMKILQPAAADISDVRLNNQPLQLALRTLQTNFDTRHGGFGGAPKFPQPAKLEFLLRSGSDMAETTLRHIAAGGINDQLGGGFFRYTVDANWRIPHFEKMLYDNGQLLFLYAQAARQYRDAYFAETAKAAANWLVNEMQSPEGGYYSSIDADSEGHEGKYYVWDRTEIEACLKHEEYTVVRLYYGLDQPSNFENHWHLYIARTLTETAASLDITLTEANNLLISARRKMLEARNKRIRPGCDHKILCSWNSLVIKGMMTTGWLLKDPELMNSAQRALTFIQNKLWINKRLLAVYKADKPLFAYLDDYAFLIDALLTSLQVAWHTEHLQFATELSDTLLKHFTDNTTGGFFFTADDHEKLLYRPKNMMDEAIPSGNGIAASALLILGHLLGDTRYLNAAEKTLQAAWPMLTHYPAEHCAVLMALNTYLEPPEIIVIRGKKNEIQSWHEASKTIHNYVFAIPDDATLPGMLAAKSSKGKTCAYVCRGTQCLEVIEDIEDLKRWSLRGI